MPEPAVGARVVERALGLLRCLCDDGVLTDASAFPGASTALTASDLARRMKLPTSTAHRLARTLADAGFLELDEGSLRYRLGRPSSNSGCRPTTTAACRGWCLSSRTSPGSRGRQLTWPSAVATTW